MTDIQSILLKWNGTERFPFHFSILPQESRCIISKHLLTNFTVKFINEFILVSIDDGAVCCLLYIIKEQRVPYKLFVFLIEKSC